MGFGDVWNRSLVYFGIAEEERWEDEGEFGRDDDHRAERRRQRQTVRRLPHAEPDAWSDAEAEVSAEQAPALSFRRPRLKGLESPRPAAAVDAQVRVHLVLPRAFNDAKQIADRFKDGVPVILNLQGADTELSKRLIDFASGLTYALDGSMQRVADRVFLLTPQNVELSAEDRARVLDPGTFFNQA